MKRNKLHLKNKDYIIFRTRFAQFFIITALALFLLLIKTKAQDENFIDSNASFAEKIYLQLDGKLYSTGNTIWFKCIVSNSVDHAPTKVSRILYVELIGPDEKVQKKKLIKIENGIGKGFFALVKSLPEGLYLIRAYTRWNKNFETDFFFKEYVHVFASSIEDKAEPINNVTLIKGQNNENRLEACFNPLVIDSLHEDKLKVFISLDGKKDSLTVNKGKDDQYIIDYIVPDECQFATLQMQTANRHSYSKTIVLDEDNLDLQFFPESGELVHGLQSKVGFKALDANGKGKIIEGDIIDEQDAVITSFKSNSLGMGSFMLNQVDSTKTCFARLTSQREDYEFLLYPLPGVASAGNVISVQKQDNNVFVTATSNYMKNDSIYLHVTFRGLNLFYKKVGLKEGVFKLLLPAEKFSEGIISFRMMDIFKQPIAERLYFNERPESRINITLSTDKDTYAKRELTSLAIKTTNSEGEPINANLSVLAINKKQMGKMQSMRQNILSWFLLDSELKGEIENPGFYFNKDSSMHSHLDALMLTQGWSKYHYSRPLSNFTFRPETTLSVTGHVSGVLSEKKRKTADIKMITGGKNGAAYSQTTDSLGRFKFNLNEEYGENIDILIQSAKDSGKNKNYTISIDRRVSPPIFFNQVKSVEKLDSVAYKLVEKNRERKIAEDEFQVSSDNIAIDEVTVTAYELTPNRKKVMEEYGKPDIVIEGNELLEKEKEWHNGLFDVLYTGFHDFVRIRSNDIGEQSAVVHESNYTIFVVDGIPVQKYESDLLELIPPGEVSSFEIIKNPLNSFQLYRELIAISVPLELQLSVIAIYTYGGGGLHAVIDQPVGLTKASVPVFSTQREFYAPKYKYPKSDEWYNKPDLRALVHWEPSIMTDRLGKATTTFYNADVAGKMQVVVEAISAKGEIGYKEIVYEVEGKDITIVN